MDQVNAFPRPASVEERIALRGCRNCLGWDNGQCRTRMPSTPTLPTDWCLDWRWQTNSRVGWESAFAGQELDPKLNPPRTEDF